MIFEPIINTHKIKYEVLKKLVDQHFTQGSHLNIYVNLDSIFKHFYKPGIVEGIEDMKGYEQMELSGAIINLIAHYRHFFWSRYGVPTSFYLYMTNKKPFINSQFHEDYMKSLIEKRGLYHPDYGPLNQCINHNMKLVNMISVYIKDAHCIPSNGLEPALGPYHIIQQHKDNPDVCHMVLTKDEYDFQLLNAAENVHVLRLKYDNSYMVHRDTIFRDKLKNLKYSPDLPISSELYSLMLAFSGVKSRDVKSLKGYGFVKVMKKLERAIYDGLLPNKYISDMMTLCHVLDCSDVYDEISNRFKAIDLKTGYQMLGTGAIETIESMLIDRYDNASIMGLNDEYYRNNPLRLIELCRGVGY